MVTPAKKERHCLGPYPLESARLAMHFMARGIPLKFKSSLFITCCVFNSKVENVRLLLAMPGVDPGRSGAWKLAAEDDKVKIMRLLLADPRVNPVDSGLLLSTC